MSIPFIISCVASFNDICTFRVVERPKRAIADMEWQKMTAVKLQLDQKQIDSLSLKLGKLSD